MHQRGVSPDTMAHIWSAAIRPILLLLLFFYFFLRQAPGPYVKYTHVHNTR